MLLAVFFFLEELVELAELVSEDWEEDVSAEESALFLFLLFLVELESVWL